MFPSARWKAYLRDLQNGESDSDGAGHKVIYHIFHSQALWFTREENNEYLDLAEERLRECDVALEESNAIITALEKERANKPKPSEMLDWSIPWW